MRFHCEIVVCEVRAPDTPRKIGGHLRSASEQAGIDAVRELAGGACRGQGTVTLRDAGQLFRR